VTEVRGHGRQKGTPRCIADANTQWTCYQNKTEMVLPTRLANRVVDTILRTAKTGKIGDGKIFYQGLRKQSGFATRSAVKTRSSHSLLAASAGLLTAGRST